MNLVSKKVDSQEELEIINIMMTTSFPKYEQTSIEELIEMSKQSGSEFMIYYSNNEVIGFTFTFEKDNLLFLYYIVVNDKYRGLGFGSKILKQIINKNKVVLLNIELLDEKSNNYDSRLKRYHFYEKSGFVRTRYLLNHEKELYEIISNVKELDVLKYKELLVKFSDNFNKSFIISLNK